MNDDQDSDEVITDEFINDLEEQGESFYVDQADAKRFRWWANDTTSGINYWRGEIDKAMAQEKQDAKSQGR